MPSSSASKGQLRSLSSKLGRDKDTLNNSDDGATSSDSSSSENSDNEDSVENTDIHEKSVVITSSKNENNSSENNLHHVFNKDGYQGVFSWTCNRLVPFISGAALTINFLLFWAIPVAGMGSLYKHTGLKKIIQPIYFYLENHPSIRSFACTYVYENPKHADFFVMLVMLCFSAVVSAGVMFYVQLTTGSLPSWLIAAHYCAWVGIGGSIMASAYGFSHKEGHNRGLYKKWIRNSVGNFVENVIGLMYGNVPFNFTTSHVFIHHHLDGSIGDSFYLWDFDRSSVVYFMMYVHRILLHMTGYSSIVYFKANDKPILANKLTNGVYIYWAVAAGILAVTRSFSFLFWFYFEPLLCMTFFLALLNIGFHGFLEFDSEGKSIECINSTTIVDGEDDFFGEDDHMAHHYNSKVYYRDLPALQEAKREEFKKYRASVFRGVSIVELSIFIVLGLWDKLADYYVDYSDAENKLSREQIKDLLRSRSQRCETNYDAYQAFAVNPSPEARESYLLTMQPSQ